MPYYNILFALTYKKIVYYIIYMECTKATPFLLAFNKYFNTIVTIFYITYNQETIKL